MNDSGLRGSYPYKGIKIDELANDEDSNRSKVVLCAKPAEVQHFMHNNANLYGR